MKKKQIFIFILIVITLLFCFSSFALADFGDFGGASDFGGDFDFGGSFDDYGDYDSTGAFVAGAAVGSASSGDDFPLGFVLLIVALIIITSIVRTRRMKRGSVAPGAQRTPDSMLSNMDSFKLEDPDFNEMDFKGNLSNLYVQLQNAWQSKDLSEVRPYFTDELYSQFDRQLESYRKNGATNRIENIAVLGIDLRGWYTDGENNNIVASMKTRIVDYVVDDKSGRILRGSTSKEKFMEYEYTLQRPRDIKTSAKTEKETTVNCPNCGAPLEINVSAKCPYCGSIVTVKGHDWIIAAIKAISQRTS